MSLKLPGLLNNPIAGGLLANIGGTLRKNLTEAAAGGLESILSNHEAAAVAKSVETYVTTHEPKTDHATYSANLQARISDWGRAVQALINAQNALEQARGTSGEEQARATREQAEAVCCAAFGVIIAYARTG